MHRRIKIFLVLKILFQGEFGRLRIVLCGYLLIYEGLVGHEHQAFLVSPLFFEIQLFNFVPEFCEDFFDENFVVLGVRSPVWLKVLQFFGSLETLVSNELIQRDCFLVTLLLIARDRLALLAQKLQAFLS